MKWAFTRLRPLLHSGSIDTASIAADDSSAVIAAPALGTSSVPLRNDADIVVAASTTKDDTIVSVSAESPSAEPSDIDVSNDSSRTVPVVVEEASVSFVGVERAPDEVPALFICNDPSADLGTDAAPVVAEKTPVSPVDVGTAPVDVPDAVIDEDPSAGVLANVEPTAADGSCVALFDAEAAAADVPEATIEGDASPSVAMEIEPALANDPPSITIVVVEGPSAGSPDVVPNVEPEPVLTSPSPQIRSAPKARVRAPDPVDRATLIRQRWAETGIRMWNPRLHGTGDATLNIQGRVELLPPAPGETMPRYDKLEFKMLGGQIACEGVIVEAPAQASQRSFTRLAEPRNPDRVREPMRNRQAALA